MILEPGNREQFRNKTIAVIGAARSGLAAAEVLQNLGARVRIYDNRSADDLIGEIQAVNALGLTPRIGNTPINYDELDLIVTSPGVRKSSPVLLEGLEHGVKIVSEIEIAYQVAEAPILAVTGTNGKTTTTVLLAEMLRASGFQTWLGGNVAAGDLSMPLVSAAIAAPKSGAIAAEISSFQLEWIADFRPKVAALLPITADHEDRQSPEEYALAKWRIFENQDETDYAIITRAFEGSPRLSGVHSDVRFFGVHDTMDDLNDYISPQLVKLPGRHNLENILCAAMMADAFGAQHSAINTVASEFKGVVHRLEYVTEIDGVRYINNSMCTNLDAFEKSLEAVPESKVLIVGGVFKGSNLVPLVRSVIENNVREAILIGRSGPAIAEALTHASFTHFKMADSLTDAVELSRQAARTGDVVMLAPACASFDWFKDFEDRGNQFKAAVLAQLSRRISGDQT